MGIDFQPLRETMERKQVTWYQLEQAGIDNRTVHRIRHNENLTLKTIDRLCNILDCDLQDVIRHQK